MLFAFQVNFKPVDKINKWLKAHILEVLKFFLIKGFIGTEPTFNENWMQTEIACFIISETALLRLVFDLTDCIRISTSYKDIFSLWDDPTRVYK